MNKLTRFLKQPYPLFVKPWTLVVIITISLVFVLSILKPFNFKMDSMVQLWGMLAFAFTTFIGASLTFVLLPKILPAIYDSERWTIGKNLLHYFFFILFLSLLNAVTDLMVLPVLAGNSPTPFSWYPFLVNTFATFTVYLIPIILIAFLTKNRELQNNLAEAVTLNQILSQRNTPVPAPEDELTLYGTTRESITVNAGDIRYMEVSGNYVDIYFVQGGEVKHKLLRVTIKQMEEQLHACPFFVRCHRAFIVNTTRIAHITGNAQECKVHLLDIPAGIPVSRRYMKSFKEAIR